MMLYRVDPGLERSVVKVLPGKYKSRAKLKTPLGRILQMNASFSPQSYK